MGTIGDNKVAIPDAFFKALLIEVNGTYSAIALSRQKRAGMRSRYFCIFAA